MRDYSVVVPTFNRPDSLEMTLKRLACLNFAPDQFEAIVVDDGSTTPVDRVVEVFEEKLTITLLQQTYAGLATARILSPSSEPKTSSSSARTRLT
jgi:glycosyltransferase involved in cell wall biosynthesis